MTSEDRTWRTARRCTADKGMCVAVRGDLAALRDTKTGLELRDVAVQVLIGHVRTAH